MISTSTPPTHVPYTCYPPDDVPGPVTKAIHPACVSSMDFFGMASAVFILSKFSPPLKLSSMRVFILEPDVTWLYYAMIFRNASTVLSSLHTLSLIFAPIGKSYRSDTVQVFGWIGVNLSDPPFNNVHTLKVYADSTDEALPLYYSLFHWLASTLEELLERQSSHLETLLVHIRICEGSRCLILAQRRICRI